MTDQGRERLAFLEAELARLKHAHYLYGDEFESDAAYFDVARRNVKAMASWAAKELG